MEYRYASTPAALRSRASSSKSDLRLVKSLQLSIVSVFFTAAATLGRPAAAAPAASQKTLRRLRYEFILFPPAAKHAQGRAGLLLQPSFFRARRTALGQMPNCLRKISLGHN